MKQRHMMRKTFTALPVTLLVIAVFSITAVPSVASAQVFRQQLGVQVANDFILEPAKTELTVDPGSSVIKQISITNRTSETTTFTIEVEDFVGTDNPEQQIQLLGGETGPYSLKNFVSPEISEFTLATGERITIPITVTLPADAEPRGYYGAIIVSSKAQVDRAADDNGVTGVTQLVTRLGSLFLVRISGDLEEASQLEVFKPLGEKQLAYDVHPDGFELATRNTGNVHLVHHGLIRIKNLFGKEVDMLPVNAFFSLPDSLRYQVINWPKSFMIGRYTAELELYKGYGDDTNTDVMKVAFWIIPWQVIVPVIVVVVLLVWLLSYVRKNFSITKKGSA